MGLFKALFASGVYKAKNLYKEEMGSFFSLSFKDLDGSLVNFDKFDKNVVLVINVGSKCGLADPSYKQMNRLYSKYQSKNFTILAFPSGQFSNQEYSDSKEIKAFVESKNAKFPVFEKSDVNGDKANPVYKWLKKAFPGEITWNFHTKFIVDRSGKPVRRFEKKTSWEEIERDIVKYL
ncbi:hypothetical protein MHBO_004100 [Bonamia ostreae]|uniref:Glutathione peroxidase n=1 Tax=Bonamia ostreae TaxID=126728 RepID=A0ABV2AT19_9EUKA